MNPNPKPRIRCIYFLSPFLVFLIPLLGACAPDVETTPPSEETEQTPPEPTKTSTPPPLATTNTPNLGDVPEDLVHAIVEDLAERLEVPQEAVFIQRAEMAIWNDSALGCPEPDRVYTQSTVEGYWVLLRVGVSDFDYRATGEGDFFFCENPAFQITPPSG